MPDVIEHPLSDPERIVVEHARRLANMSVENQHQSYIPQLLAPWFTNASPMLREALSASFKLGQEAQREVSRVLERIQPIELFAEPLLKQALAARGWVDVDTRQFGIKQVRLLSNMVIFVARQHLRLVDSLIQLALPDVLTPESL